MHHSFAPCAFLTTRDHSRRRSRRIGHTTSRTCRTRARSGVLLGCARRSIYCLFVKIQSHMKTSHLNVFVCKCGGNFQPHRSPRPRKARASLRQKLSRTLSSISFPRPSPNSAQLSTCHLPRKTRLCIITWASPVHLSVEFPRLLCPTPTVHPRARRGSRELCLGWPLGALQGHTFVLSWVGLLSVARAERWSHDLQSSIVVFLLCLSRGAADFSTFVSQKLDGV